LKPQVFPVRALRIAVDLDGVLAETMEAWCKRVNELYGTRLTLEDLDTWTSWRKIGVTKDQFFQILDEVWDTWEDIPPTEPGLAKKVAKAEKFGNLDIVTGRSKKTVESAKLWLSHHKVPFERFVRVQGWRDKVFLNYDVYIDDAPELMPLISRNPAMRGILYERPWNREVGSIPRVYKVDSWTQIPNVLREILDE
jgi:5'(3')-deoxyribonucleotidase